MHNHNNGLLNNVINHKFSKALGCFSTNPIGCGSGKVSDFFFFSINIVGYKLFMLLSFLEEDQQFS